MIMIDFVKITSDLFVLDFLKILFAVIGFLFFIGTVFGYVFKKKEKIITISIFVLVMVAIFYGTEYIGIRQFIGMREVLKKAGITNLKNLKRNRKIVEDAIKYNGTVKDKNEYINTLLNKFYINGKDATPEEKEIMQKLKNKERLK